VGLKYRKNNNGGGGKKVKKWKEGGKLYEKKISGEGRELAALSNKKRKRGPTTQVSSNRHRLQDQETGKGGLDLRGEGYSYQPYGERSHLRIAARGKECQKGKIDFQDISSVHLVKSIPIRSK